MTIISILHNIQRSVFHSHSIDERRWVLPRDSAPLSDAEYGGAQAIVTWQEHLLERREDYIDATGCDRAVNLPDANWSRQSGFLAACPAICFQDRGILNMLRIFTQQFTGHYMGLQPARGRAVPRVVPDDIDDLVRIWLMEHERREPWWLSRYAALTASVPGLADLSLPCAFGESGFRRDDVILNHDLFVYLERLALLQTAGVIDRLNQKERPVILEIGSGFGGLAYLMRKRVPDATYICLDLPESLMFAALYLHRFFPNLHLADENTDWSNTARHDFLLVPNYMFHRLVDSGLRVDLAINTLSMSEMSVEQVRTYCTGLVRLIGDTGVFFEQNQNNRASGLCFAKEIAAEIFGGGERLELPTGLSQGSATLWNNPSF